MAKKHKSSTNAGRALPDKYFSLDNNNFFCGIDYGYANEPAVAVLITKIGESMFVHELDNWEKNERSLTKLAKP